MKNRTDICPFNIHAFIFSSVNLFVVQSYP